MQGLITEKKSMLEISLEHIPGA